MSKEKTSENRDPDKTGKDPPYMKHVYDGDQWGIFYLPIDDFEQELPELGKALDHIQQNHGEATAVIPNIGLTKASLLLGTSFQGVKGFAIIYKKHNL
ncbi:hypothetical protein N186_09235 [Thermofilum adornatum]|uniref:Uncharacterized protein n=2 Tax=Thermofilum TaxID=2268 RepID=S5ZG72_9CREN|nr:hypothetical protein [Thermofilum adornatum]AGT36183.1 hypothetical protein N186_09235 [Thermofilum adornatum]